MNTFEVLSKVDVSKFTEKKGKFSYLSWADAVDALLKHCPNAMWTVVKDINGYPYTTTPAGCFVEVELTIDGITRTQIHPVLNNYNKPIMEPNCFDINTSIQRCLAKVIGLHGLGLYIYRGEDLPDLTPKQQMSPEPINQVHVQQSYESWKAIIDADADEMDWKTVQAEYALLTNDERIAVASLFGSDKPEGSNKGYKAIIKELLHMSEADESNPDNSKVEL